VMARYSGAARLINRYRAILDESGGPRAFESLFPVVDEALAEERPDPGTVEALAAFGLHRLWLDARG